MTPENSRYIAVAGMIATGKTTLARSIAKHLAWEYVPETRNAINYLDNLYKEPSRWAFEAQVAFLLEKAIVVMTLEESNRSFVLDRTFPEDAEVFAEYFHIQGYISQRSFITYAQLYNLVNKTLRQPDMVIVCSCSLELIHMRLATRGSEAWNYPLGFLDQISSMYTTWFERLKDARYPVYAVDSAQFDFRQDTVVSRVCEEINQALTSSTKKNGIGRTATKNNSNIMVRIC